MLDPVLADLAAALSRRGDADAADVQGAGELGAPADYCAFVASFDGAEGWIGSAYVALWPAADVPRHNQTLDTATYAADILLFGTDGGGEGYGFDLTDATGRVVRVPLVGLSRDRMIVEADSFTSWLLDMARSGRSPAATDRVLVGMNVYDIKPVLLGGDPASPSNKAVVTLEQLLEIATWWNVRIRAMESPADPSNMR